MAKTQTWRGDKSRANVESTWSGALTILPLCKEAKAECRTSQR